MSDPGSHRCLNCDAPAPESFCPRCGQATRERRAPFLSIVKEVLDHLSLDGALPRSLFNLLLRPGSLTELYLAGKRASYVPPVRMYLVISLVFFVIFAIRPPDVSEVDVYVGGELVGPTKPEPRSPGSSTASGSTPSPSWRSSPSTWCWRCAASTVSGGGGSSSRPSPSAWRISSSWAWCSEA